MNPQLNKLIEEIEDLITKRKWLLNQIRKFEEKYKMTSKEFHKAWTKGLIPEPNDPETHGDFIVWEGLIEELKHTEEKLATKIKG
ncbi:hypothetical protein DRO24_02030 [Candidatus Bathyarchaeota archaeon]|nr:MAG: hypothetical protein DRO24_02030 [Candidatus Bathyarchaeota archaeon]